jgi:hypothetical protein
MEDGQRVEKTGREMGGCTRICKDSVTNCILGSV